MCSPKSWAARVTVMQLAAGNRLLVQAAGTLHSTSTVHMSWAFCAAPIMLLSELLEVLFLHVPSVSL